MTDIFKPKSTRRFARTPVGQVQTGSEAALATPEGAALAAPAAPAPKAESTTAQAIASLQSKEGATLEEMVAVHGRETGPSILHAETGGAPELAEKRPPAGRV